MNQQEDQIQRRKQANHRYYVRHLQYEKERSKQKRLKNPERYRKMIQQWRVQHPEYSGEYKKERRLSDIEFKILENCRSRLNRVLNGQLKTDHTIILLGCTIQQLKLYLEKQFKNGMSWDNYGLYGWHIDHIIPCFSFNLSDPEQQKKCFHYTNLQPLWAKDNLSKGKKLTCNHMRI